MAEEFRKAGANAFWIPQGLDPDEFYPAQSDKDLDVVFVGSRDRKRQDFVAVLRRAGIRVTCFGQGWENGPRYRDELADIYRRSKVVLNFCREGAGFSIRVLQVMGAGFSINAFMIYDRWGEKVFETNNINQGWDGTFRGKMMNAAVFVYYVEAICFNTNEEVFKKGDVTLVR